VSTARRLASFAESMGGVDYDALRGGLFNEAPREHRAIADRMGTPADTRYLNEFDLPRRTEALKIVRVAAIGDESPALGVGEVRTLGASCQRDEKVRLVGGVRANFEPSSGEMLGDAERSDVADDERLGPKAGHVRACSYGHDVASQEMNVVAQGSRGGEYASGARLLSAPRRVSTDAEPFEPTRPTAVPSSGGV